MTVLEAALAYRELGLSVIPVSTTGKQKKPHSTALLEIYGSSSWKRFRDQPASRDEIRGWYEVAPGAGVAILTGCVSDVIVADFDDRTRVPSFPLTPVATTGRGLHVYLRGQARRRQTLFGDLLGSGTYAVAPPSLHHSGRAYSWQITPPGMGNVFLPEADFVDADEAGHLVFDDVWEDSGRDTYYTREVGLSPSGADASSEEFARQALQQIGVRSTSLKQIRCPFHPDGTPSAGLFRGSTDGGWVFKCQACDTTLTLGQLYAKARGALLNGPTVRKWWDRLLFEIGLLALPELPPITRPAGTASLYKFSDGLLLLLRIDAYGSGIDPRDLVGVPYTASFGSPWAGISQSSFVRARGELVESKWLEKRGEIFAGRRTNLWLPSRWPVPHALPREGGAE